jgi:hypothetical protein
VVAVGDAKKNVSQAAEAALDQCVVFEGRVYAAALAQVAKHCVGPVSGPKYMVRGGGEARARTAGWRSGK